MTLNAKDIAKIQKLYAELDELQTQRRKTKDAVFKSLLATLAKGTSGIEYLNLAEPSAEAMAEIRDVLARDIRRRAAKIVEALHGLGCEAKLTE